MRSHYPRGVPVDNFQDTNRRDVVVVDHPVMQWLAAGLPLALLMDLAGDDVPDSGEILRTEAAIPGGARIATRRILEGMATY
jgi:hypothetical protein